MSYTHLTISERAKIEAYLELGYSKREIARQLKRSPSTISRELKRHTNWSAEVAHDHYQTNKSNLWCEVKTNTNFKGNGTPLDIGR